MKTFLSPSERAFYSLSVKDLLEAREAYHVHLYNKENVIATAIGLYRIRNSDPDAKNPAKKTPRGKGDKRTLNNTVVRPWSWPCILVFVREWAHQKDLRDKPDQVVPPFLYMPDGRIIPTCVILAERKEQLPPRLSKLTFPSELMGGGYPVLSDVQGRQHIGSLGCLVTDGDSVYALTNKHVTGEKPDYEQEQREIYTLVNGKHCKIGNTYHKQIGKMLFQQVYRGWPGANSYSNVDAGLIKLDDINYWTAQVFGIGELDEIADLSTFTISLDLIGCPVTAFGGASGKMLGEIQALFYRYKSLGGFDYISDLLIGPRDENSTLLTQPGDSGTVWVYDPTIKYSENSSSKNKLTSDIGTEDHSTVMSDNTNDEMIIPAAEKGKQKRLSTVSSKISTSSQGTFYQKSTKSRILQPIALQWGGHILMDGRGQSELSFALATCLSTICRELDVDIVRNWNIGQSEYWGKLAHYKIGAKACDLLSNAKLSKLMQANVNKIAFDDDSIRQGNVERINSHSQFVPLADVADYVWRRTRPSDDNNHFADMDETGHGDFNGQTLLDLTTDPKNIDIEVWNKFYDSFSNANIQRGALPFRVWQIYKQMVKFVSQGDIEKFVCAAGLVSHYIGDASQPLHVSKFHHGHPGNQREKLVHATYETGMIDKFAAEIITGVNDQLKDKKVNPENASGSGVTGGGQNAATSVIDLMKKCVGILPPLTIVDAYDQAINNTGNDATCNDNCVSQMFNILGIRTISCISEGCLKLALIWENAWKEGNGDQIPDNKIVEVDSDTLKNLYEDDQYLEAFRLNDPRYMEDLN